MAQPLSLRWGVVVFGAIWFLVGAPFLCIGLVVGIRTLSQLDSLQKVGQVVDGTVIAKSIKRPSGKNRRAEPHYRVSYRFLAPYDGIVEGDAQVGAHVWDRLTEGGPVQVTYLVEQAHVHQIEGQVRDLALPVIFTALGSIFTSLGGFVLWRGFRIERARSQPQQPQEQRQPRSNRRARPVTAATPPVAKKSALLQGIWNLAFVLVIVLLARILDEILQPIFEAFERFVQPYEFQLWGTVIGITVLGFILMLGSILDLLLSPQTRSAACTFHSMKAAWRSGTWLRVPRWRRHGIVIVGGLMFVCGMLSFFFLLGPPSVKLLLGGALLYMLVRLRRAFWRP